MSFASVGTLGTIQEKTSDTSLVLTTSATLEAGNLAILAIALDNFNTTDADHSEVSSVADDAGNAWEKLLEYTNGQGSAAAGATVSLWATVADTQLTSGSDITITLSDAVTAKAASAWEFTLAESSINVAGSNQAVGDAADPAAITISSLSSKEYLWVHALAIEIPPSVGYTQDADYTSIDNEGTTGAASTSNISIFGGFRVFTGTSDTVDVSTSSNRDHAQVYVAIEEVAGADTVSPAGLQASATLAAASAEQTHEVSPAGLQATATLAAATVTSSIINISPAGLSAAATLASPGVSGVGTGAAAGDTSAPIQADNLGLTLSFFKPIITSGTSYSPRGQWLFNLEYFEQLEFEIAAQAGYKSATLSFVTTQEVVDEWLEQGLGRTLVIYNEAQNVVWSGLVNEITADIERLTYYRGPLLGDTANRVWVSYTPVLDDDVYPPITGSQTETTIVEDDDSKERFGILERIYSGGTTLPGLAEQTRDMIAQEVAWPTSSGDPAIQPQGGQVKVSLNLVGFYAFLRHYYVDDETVSTVTLSTKITDTLGADVNGLFSTDYSQIAENLAIISASEEGRRAAIDIISDVISRGDANFDVYTFGIYAEERAHYQPEPTSAEYEYLLGDAQFRLRRQSNGERVYPWNVLPGKYLFFPNHMIGRVREGLPLREDPRFLFIENVRYSTPWNVAINGVRVSDLPQYLAQLGAGQV